MVLDNCFKVITIISDSSLLLIPPLHGWKHYRGANENPDHPS